MHTFDKNNFISKLGDNINKYYVVTGFFEKWFFSTQGREWDSKRGELENLIRRHLYPVYDLMEISNKLKENSEKIIENLFDNLDNKLSSIKSLYFQGTSDYDDSNSFMGICLQISKLKQIYNNENSDISEYILEIAFGEESNKIDSKYENEKYTINFDNQKNANKILSFIEKTDFKFWLKDKSCQIDGPDELDIEEEGCKMRVINKNVKLRTNETIKNNIRK